MAFRARKSFRDFRETSPRTPGARFSNVPKLCGLFPGVTIPFVSQERRGFKSSNFTVFFLFPWKHVKRSPFQNKRLAVSQMVFWAPKVFGTFEKQAPGFAKIIPFSTNKVFVWGYISYCRHLVFLLTRLRLNKLALKQFAPKEL